MDSGLDLAKAVLDRLRKDLRHLGPGNADELDSLLGRAPRYLRRIKPSQLLLPHASIASDYLGLTLVERIQRILGIRANFIPLGAEELFGRYPSWAPSRVPTFGPQLDSFLEWVCRVDLGTMDSLQLDLNHRLETLGHSHPESGTVQRYARLLFQSLVRLPPILSNRSARDLARSLSFLLDHTPKRTMPQRAAAKLLAVAFHLESLAEDLPLRQRLYAQGSHISESLGFPLDAVWCWRQHLLLAALRGDGKALELGSQRVNGLTAQFKLAGVIRWPVDLSHSLKPSPPEDLAQQRFLKTLSAERKVSRVTESDQHIGGSRAMNRLLRGEGSVTLERYARWVGGLGVEPGLALEKVQALEVVPPDPERLLQGLKLGPVGSNGSTAYMQVAKWSKEVRVLNSSSDRKPPGLAMRGIRSESERRLLMEEVASVLSGHPTVCPTEIAVKAADRLLLVTNFLMEAGQYDAGIDAIGAAIRLHQRAPVFERVATDYRQAAYLALHCGRPDVSQTLLQRSRSLDLATGSLQGFALTTYAQTILNFVLGNHRQSYEMAQCCLRLHKSEQCRLPELSIHALMGSNSLALRKFDLAQHHITDGDRVLSDDWPEMVAEFLIVKAEFLSQTGYLAAASEAFEQARASIPAETGAQLLALLGLSKTSHLIRYGLEKEAVQEAHEILRLSSRLINNPIGQQALQSVARLVFDGRPLDAVMVRGVRNRVEYPNLFSR